jgi:phosphotriesterase-related protein
MAFVRTTLGDIDPAKVGDIMFHEHVLFDIVPNCAKGDRKSTIGMQDRWQIDYRSNENAANAHQTDPEIATDEVLYFSADGGSLIVDQSVYGLARNPTGLARIARATGVHLVAAAGSYTKPYLSSTYMNLDVEKLTNLFIREVNEGIEGTNIRAGLIGEMGCSWPMAPFERRALQAAARAARATGAALSVHPGNDSGSCTEILDIVEAEGLDPQRIILCHMDRTYPDGIGISQLLERNANVEWDFFGIEQSYYWMGEVDLPNDNKRLSLIRQFVDKGYASQILISQDICTKTRLRQWGGHGYGHILRNVVPLMKKFGFEASLINQLLRENPLRLLTIKENAA